MLPPRKLNINHYLLSLLRQSCLLSVLFTCSILASAQQAPSAAGAFHNAANYYIAGQQQEALKTVEQGLRHHPNDPKLQALHQKLTQQQQQNKNNNQNQNQNQNSQQKEQASDGESSDNSQQKQGEKKDQPGGEQQQDKEQQQQRESEDGEGEEQQVQARDPQGEVEKRLQEMNISPEKARMVLEAMRSNEIQYLQQQQRKPERRSKSNKPDW